MERTVPQNVSWLGRYLRSSIGAKHVMAITGLVLVLFVLQHMTGHLVMFLGRDAYNDYAHWARFQAMGAPSEDRSVTDDQERRRYYRLVLPLEPDKPLVSSHPLTWTTISHVIWDGMSPDILTSPQQQAMLDWLHWGGQLTIIGIDAWLPYFLVVCTLA